MYNKYDFPTLFGGEMYIIPIVIAIILTLLAILVYYAGKEKRFWRIALIVVLITIAIRISDPALATLLES